MASLADWTNGIGGNIRTLECRTRRLDDLVEERKLGIPQFIKCDVEGAELAVFRGGINTLNREEAPVIMFELNARAATGFGWLVEDYLGFLESLTPAGYKFFEVFPDGLKELARRDIEYANLVAVPRTKQNFV